MLITFSITLESIFTCFMFLVFAYLIIETLYKLVMDYYYFNVYSRILKFKFIRFNNQILLTNYILNLEDDEFKNVLNFVIIYMDEHLNPNFELVEYRNSCLLINLVYSLNIVNSVGK
jgi:hypothetical protein